MIGLKQKNIYIGIDIGASTIKVVELEISPLGEPILKKANLVAKADGLKKAISGVHLKGAKVIGIVDCPMSSVRYITVPIMPGRELAEAIKWEAKDKIPVSLDKVNMDYEVKEEVEEAGVKKLKVRVAATPTETVNNVLYLLSEVGIEPISLIQPSIAFEHLSKHLILKRDESVAIIDVGCEFATIGIMKNNVIKFHRRIPVGGSAVTKAMTGAFISDQGRVEISEADAEKIKQEHGIPKEEVILGDKKLSAMQLRSLIRPAAERLLNEIGRSFEYYREETGRDRVGSVILLGGGSSLKGLDEFLQDSLGISVSVGDPLQGINVAKGANKDTKAVAHRFGIALGAALSEGKGINLLPKELKEKTKRTFERAGIEAVVAAVVVSLILTFIGMRVQIASYNKKTAAGNFELKVKIPQLEVALSYERVQSEISKRESLINGILNNTPLWKDVFKEISNVVPKEVMLKEMSMENNALVMKGEILGTGQDREEVLSNFISALEGKMFKDVSLLTAKIGDQEKGKSEFEIKCVSSTE